MKPSKITIVPKEILFMILDHVCPQSLLRICHVRILSDVARDLLYRRFYGDSHNIAKFLRTILQNPELASRVRYVCLQGLHTSPGSELPKECVDIFAAAIQSLPISQSIKRRWTQRTIEGHKEALAALLLAHVPCVTGLEIWTQDQYARSVYGVAQPGQDAYFQLSDYIYTPDAHGSTHYGGSCQVGFSTDHGRSWRAATSYQGNCPHRGVGGSPEAQTFFFNVPTGMPEGKALFGWIWLNREHESFMNCAVVQINRSLSIVGNQSATAEIYTPSNAFSPHTTEGSNVHEMLFSNAEAASMISELSISAELAMGNALLTRSHVKSNSSHQATSKVDEGTDRRLLNNFSSLAGSIKTQGCADIVQRASAELCGAKKCSAACNWDTAPPMAVSYYTVDAACLPNAKMVYDKPDMFEVGWAVPCGNIKGDGEYPIQVLDCVSINL